MGESRIAYLLWGTAAVYSRSANAYQKIRLAVENLDATIVLPSGCLSWLPEDFKGRARVLEFSFPKIFLHGKVGKVFEGLFCSYASFRLRRRFDKFLVNTGNEFVFFWIRLAEIWARLYLLCWDPPGIAARDGESRVARLRCALMDRLFAATARKSLGVILNLHEGFLGRFPQDVHGKFHVFPNGTNVSVNRAAASGVVRVPKRIAVNGAFDAVKGCWDVANLFADIWALDHDVSLVWTGRGSEKDAVAKLFDEKGIPPTAYTLGFGSHDYTMVNLATASVALNAYRVVESLRWNYVLKAPEFLSLGLPIVSVRLPGVAYYIEDGQTGVFFKSGDWIEAKAAICDLLTDRDRLLKMQERAGRVAEKFEWSDINRRIAQTILRTGECES